LNSKNDSKHKSINQRGDVKFPKHIDKHCEHKEEESKSEEKQFQIVVP
jgi:hypothetical protein